MSRHFSSSKGHSKGTNDNSTNNPAPTRHHIKAAWQDYDESITQIDRRDITAQVHRLEDEKRRVAGLSHKDRTYEANQQTLKKTNYQEYLKEQKKQVTKRLNRQLPLVGPEVARIQQEERKRLKAKKVGSTKGDLGPQMGIELQGNTTQYLNTDDHKLNRHLKQAPTHAQIIVQSQEGDQAWKQFRLHHAKSLQQDLDNDEIDSTPSDSVKRNANDRTGPKKEYDQQYTDTRDAFIKAEFKRQQKQLKSTLNVFDGIDKTTNIDQEAMFNAQELWKVEAREKMREMKKTESLISTTNDELVVREVEVLTTRRQIDKQKQKVRQEIDQYSETMRTLDVKSQGAEIKQLRTQIKDLTRQEEIYEKEMDTLLAEIQSINKDRHIRTLADSIGTHEDISMGSKRSKYNDGKKTKRGDGDRLVQLGETAAGGDDDDDDDNNTDNTKNNQPKEKKLFGKKALLAKLAGTNAELRAQFLGQAQDEHHDDPLLRRRGDELALYEAETRRKEAKEAKSSLHTQYIKASMAFMKATFDRVKKSKQAIKNGGEPLHEYDHFINYPLDVAAIVDKFTSDPATLEAFEWLHNTRGLIWDFKATKAKKDNLKKERKEKQKQGEENQKDTSALKFFDEKQRLASMLNHDNSVKGQSFLELRPITNNDVAYMAKQRIRVGKMEKVLQKENQYINLQTKSTERQYRNQRLQQKTSQGQPVMKHKMKDLLKKISKTHG